MPKVKLNKRYILKNDKGGKKVVEPFTEVDLTEGELKNIDKKDIVQPGDEKK